MSGQELDQLRQELVRQGRPPLPADVAGAMRRLGLPVSDAALMATVEALRRDAVGAGELEPLLRLSGVTDVLVNGAGQVFIDRGSGLELTEVRFDGEESVRRLASRMAAGAGRRLDDGSPFVDARLADGTRMHAVLAPLAHPGTCISLRVPADRRFRLSDWVEVGSVPRAGVELLAAMVHARAAFLISGGTGSGKTTLLASMLAEVGPQERLVVVEDSRELQPDHPHCIRLEARAANAEGAGAVSLTDLVRQALRMRPDRIVLGEVRGGELCDLLTALNTGHEGGCGTVHANSAADVPARLAALGALGGMSSTALQAQAAAALELVVHVTRERGATGATARRRVAGVQLVDRDQDGLRMVPAVEFTDAGGLRQGPGFPALEALCAR